MIPAFPQKMGRYLALVDAAGHLLVLGRSHRQNATWAEDHGFQVVAQDQVAKQLDLFGGKSKR